jgi:hypothetical protein
MATLGVEVTEETALVQKNVDKDVVAKAAEVESARTMRQAAEAYGRGDQKGAITLIQKAEHKAKETARAYDLPAEKMAPTMDALANTGTSIAATPPASAAAPAVTKAAKSDSLMMSH